jgi:hypothetical protein
MRGSALGDERHAYGSRLALAGTPLFIIAKLMGTSVAMVEKHYAAYSPEAGVNAVERVFGAAGAEPGATPVQQGAEQRRTAADTETALAA